MTRWGLTQVKLKAPNQNNSPFPLSISLALHPYALSLCLFISFDSRSVAMDTGGRLPPARLFGYNKNKRGKAREREKKGRETRRKG